MCVCVCAPVARHLGRESNFGLRLSAAQELVIRCLLFFWKQETKEDRQVRLDLHRPPLIPLFPPPDKGEWRVYTQNTRSKASSRATVGGERIWRGVCVCSFSFAILSPLSTRTITTHTAGDEQNSLVIFHLFIFFFFLFYWLFRLRLPDGLRHIHAAATPQWSWMHTADLAAASATATVEFLPLLLWLILVPFLFLLLLMEVFLLAQRRRQRRLLAGTMVWEQR